MNSPPAFSPEQVKFNEQIAQLTLKVARPLVWHNLREDWPKRLFGGTCCILRFEAGLIGVTADHVIGGFEEANVPGEKIVCLLRTVPFDLPTAIIDRDATLDIATFRITEEQLIASEGVAVDCRLHWPPPEPAMGTALSLAGFPEALKQPALIVNMEFRAYVSQVFVQDVSEREILVTYEPDRDIRVLAAPELPDLGANLSGCSGGPALMHIQQGGLHQWFVVGIIISGSGDAPKGAMKEFDIIRVRRVKSIRQDGIITR